MTRTFDLRNVAQKEASFYHFAGDFVDYSQSFRKIVKIERLKFKVMLHGTIRNNDS